MKFDLKILVIGVLSGICLILALGQTNYSETDNVMTYQMEIAEPQTYVNVIYVLNSKTGTLWRYLDSWNYDDYTWKSKWSPAIQVPEKAAKPEK